MSINTYTSPQSTSTQGADTQISAAAQGISDDALTFALRHVAALLDQDLTTEAFVDHGMLLAQCVRDLHEHAQTGTLPAAWTR